MCIKHSNKNSFGRLVEADANQDPGAPTHEKTHAPFSSTTGTQSGASGSGGGAGGGPATSATSAS